MRSSVAVAVSSVLGLAAAGPKDCKQLSTGANVGNPIHEPALNKIVPAGTPFTITWTPTDTTDFVSLQLLRGPSTNILPDGCIIDHIPNTGSYAWTPPTTLEPDVTHYGLKIIVDGSGDFQYSNQFGVSNPAYGHTTTTTSRTHTKAKHTQTVTGKKPIVTKAHPHANGHPHPHHKAIVSQLPDGQPIAPTQANITHTQSIVVSTLSLNASSLTPAPSASVVPPPKSHNITNVHLTVPASLKTSTASAHRSTVTGVRVVNGTTIGGPTQTTASATSTNSPATQPSAGAAMKMGAAGLVAGLGAMAALVL